MFDGIVASHRIKLIQICVAGIQVRNVLCFPIGCEEDSQSFPQSLGGLSFCKLDG